MRYGSLPSPWQTDPYSLGRLSCRTFLSFQPLPMQKSTGSSIAISTWTTRSSQSPHLSNRPCRQLSSWFRSSFFWQLLHFALRSRGQIRFHRCSLKHSWTQTRRRHSRNHFSLPCSIRRHSSTWTQLVGFDLRTCWPWAWV